MAERFAFTQVQSQLGVPDSSSFFPIRKSETLVIENQPLVIQKVNFYASFALDVYPNSLMDDGRFVIDPIPTSSSTWDLAKWDVNRWDETVPQELDDHYIVSNENDLFQWRFRFGQGSVGINRALDTTGFTDSDNSVGTEDTTTNYNFTGSTWQSLSIFRDPLGEEKISQVNLTTVEGTLSNVSYAASNDGGVTWSTITIGTPTAFSSLNSDLRLKINVLEGGWPTAWDSWGFTGTMIIERIICEYTRV